MSPAHSKSCTCSKSNQGIVLVVVLGVLALLSVLAITFVSITRLERSISRNYVDRTRVVMAAESGIEAAIAEISQFQGGTLRPYELEHMEYNPDEPEATFDKATKLSFMSSEPGPGGVPISGVVSSTHVENGDYYLLKVTDESGKLNLNDSNAFVDPNNDTSGRLFNIISNLAYILFASDKGEDIGPVVASVLLTERHRLGGKFSMLSQVDDILISLNFTSQERKKLLSNVTLWSWQDPDVIKPIPAFGSFDNALDLYGNPNPDNGFPRYGFPFMRWEEVQSFNDGDDANGLHDYGYQLEPRCPVNLNTASKELIQALLAGLEGWTVFEGPSERYQRVGPGLGGWDDPCYGYWCSLSLYNEDRGLDYYPNFLYETTPRESNLFRNAANKIILDSNEGTDFKPLGLPYARLRITKIPDISADPDFSGELARDLYNRIHGLDIYTENPNPIENWREFKFYLDRVIDRAKAGELPELAIDDPFAADESEATWTYDRGCDFQYFNEYYRDLILANFDPNTMTNDFNPDLVVYRFTDKADLITYTTEFCFEPTGTFRIASLGRVLEGGDGNPVRAEQGIKAVVKMFECKRLTTQAQFVGTETLPDAIEDRFGVNESPYPTKWGCTITVENGTRLVSHPEPIVERLDDPFGFVKNSIFDGRIGLSPIKHNMEGIMEGIDSSAVLWSSFEGSMNAMNPGLANGGQVPPGLPSEEGSVWKYKMDIPDGYFDVSIDIVAEELREKEDPLMAASSTSGKPGTLYVDGVFSEAWKCPAYPLRANGESHLSFNQTLLMTLKPGFMMKDSNRSRNFFTMGQGGRSNCYKKMLAVSRLQYDYYGGLNAIWPSAPSGNDQHPLCFGYGWAQSCRVSGIHFQRTNYVNTDQDSNREYYVDGKGACHFEGRRWNLMTVSWGGWWDVGVANFISVNGQQSDPSLRSSVLENSGSLDVPFTIYYQQSGGPPIFNPDNLLSEFPAPIRLGAFVRPQGKTKSVFEPADSTFGEFIFYKEVTHGQSGFENLDMIFWEEGFYYHDPGEPAAYTTPEINLSAKPGKAVTIRSISWTGHWPQYVMAADVNKDSTPDPVWGTAEYIDYFQQTVGEDMPLWLENMSSKDDPETWDPFTLDIFADDKWLYAESEPDPWNPPQTPLSYSGGSIPRDTDGYKLTTENPIKLKFYFNLADDQVNPQVEPLRESPYLDDITITYIPAKGVTFLYYQMH
ncbi:hypothetical protein ACFL54_05415 [Planctomycetota bacterium]